MSNIAMEVKMGPSSSHVQVEYRPGHDSTRSPVYWVESRRQWVSATRTSTSNTDMEVVMGGRDCGERLKWREGE